MTVDAAILVKKSVSFSHAIEDNEDGESVVVITLCGHKKEWEPKLRQLIQDHYNDNDCGEALERVIDQLDDSLEVVTIKIPFSRVKEPENAITSISEIPAAVKGTDLPVSRLTREVNGVNREVIMLGETHVATSKEAKAVSRIMPYFKNVGCEGVDISEILEGRIFFWFMEKTVILISIFSLGKRSGKHKSSLELAQDYAEDVQAKKRVISLERGWRPSLRLRAFFVAFPLYILWSMCMIGSSGVDIGSEYGWLWTIAFIGGVVLFSCILIYVPVIKHVISFIISLIFDYIFDVTPSRNRNMSKNVVTVLEENALIDSILVVVGKDHVKPMVKILKNKYGFSEKAFT